MNLEKYQDESVSQYIARICKNRVENGMMWDDVRDTLNAQLGANFSESYYRKGYASGKFGCGTLEADIPHDYIGIREDLSISPDDDPENYRTAEDSDELQKLVEAQRKLQMERMRLSEERTANNAALRRQMREETIKEIAHDFAAQMDKKYKYVFETPDGVDINDMEGLLLIGDWHYGIEIDSIFNKYSPEIATKRVVTLANKVIKKCRERKVNKLTVLNLGDLISGLIHLQLRITSRIDVITQVMEVSEILANFLYKFVENGMEVRYASVLDNHSRIDPNKKEAIRLESLARITDWYLKERFKPNEDGYSPVTFLDNTYDLNIASFTIKGFDILGVHGDLDKPGKLIDGITTFTQNHFDLICSAHLHHFFSNESNNTLLISNGSLMGTDDYAFSLRLNSSPSQTLVFVSDDNVCEEMHRIVVE